MVVVSALRGPLDEAALAELLADARLVVTVEEDLAPGALHGLACRLVAGRGLQARVRGLALEARSASFRRLDDCLRHFGFVPERLRELVLEGC